jgi:hypothetical protein
MLFYIWDLHLRMLVSLRVLEPIHYKYQKMINWSSRPQDQLQRFHMSDLVTSPNTTNKEMSSDEGQRKEVYYAAWAHRGKRQSKHCSPSLGYRH